MVRRAGVWSGPLTVTAVNTTALTITVFTVNTSVVVGDIVMKVGTTTSYQDSLNYCSTYTPKNFKPFKMFYKIATPQMVDESKGGRFARQVGQLPTLDSGFNMLESFSGYVRHEMVQPSTTTNNANYLINNLGYAGVEDNPLQYPTQTIVQIYEDGSPMSYDWIMVSDYSYGKQRAQIPALKALTTEYMMVDYYTQTDLYHGLCDATLTYIDGLANSVDRLIESSIRNHIDMAISQVNQKTLQYRGMGSGPQILMNMAMSIQKEHLGGVVFSNDDLTFIYSVEADDYIKALPGTIITFVQCGAGAITLAPKTNVIFRGKTNGTMRTTNGQGAVMFLMKLGPDEWIIFGDSKV